MNAIHEAYYAALKADEAFAKAVKDAGFKSRWHLPDTVMQHHDAVRSAFIAKKAAFQLYVTLIGKDRA